jgi:hypothetical protein
MNRGTCCGRSPFVAVFLVLIVPLVGGEAANGQQKGGIVFDSINLMTNLLEHSEVQKELEMNQSQVDSIGKKAKELSIELKDEIRQALLTGTGFDEFRETYLERDRELSSELSESQQKRLKQLHFQRLGSTFWSLPEVQDALKLTEKQREEIAASRAAIQKKAKELSDSGELFRDGPDKVTEKLEVLNQEHEAQVTKMIDEDQTKILVELRGKPFQFPKQKFR